MPGLNDVQAITAGLNHTCALEAGGALTCFGVNEFGQLGAGRTDRSTVPRAVVGISGTVDQVVSSGQFACALAGTEVRCWGDNRTGALGTGAVDGTTYLESAVAVLVPGLPPVQAIAAGSGHACALTTGGAVWCWGSRVYGQTGDGATNGVGQFSPVAVVGLGSGVTSITAGGEHACAVTAAGAVVCWGRNQEGQRGDGTTTSSAVPVPVSGLTSGVATVDAGPTHTCATTGAGALWCWGRNQYGQLGNASMTSSLVPVPVTGLDSGVSDVSSGLDHTCAVVAGQERCWGLGPNGRLGRGTEEGSTFPLPVEGATGPAVAVALGRDHSCGITAGGTLRCWGTNEHGQLATGDLADRLEPVPVAFSSSVRAAAAGGGTTCAALSSGGVSCWGRDDVSQMGTGTRQRVVGGSTFYAGHPAIWYPFASWAALVQRLYIDLTAKAPTSSELSAWVTSLTAGTATKGDLAAALRSSSDNLVNVDATARLYRAFLGRAPDRDGLLFWIGRRRSGTWKLVRMADSFAGSTEFKRKYGTLSNKAFVTLIYTDVMGRTADPGGVAYWTGKLDAGSSSRGGVMVGFSESNEYKRKQASNTDAAIGHILLLGRTASAPETTRWSTLQGNGVTNAVLLLDLLDSNEFARRFLP